MPMPYLKSLSDKYDIPVDKLETKYEEAKKAIGDQYNDNEKAKYGAIIKVFKNIINKEYDLNECVNLTVDDAIYIARKLYK